MKGVFVFLIKTICLSNHNCKMNTMSKMSCCQREQGAREARSLSLCSSLCQLLMKRLREEAQAKYPEKPYNPLLQNIFPFCKFCQNQSFFWFALFLLFDKLFMRVVCYKHYIWKRKGNGDKVENKFLLLSERSSNRIKNYLPSDSEVSLLADFFQNLADSTRLKIISCLSLCDMCVNDICQMLSFNQTTVSHQLQILKAQNLVSYRREGKVIIYSLISKQINDVLSYASESI